MVVDLLFDLSLGAILYSLLISYYSIITQLNFSTPSKLLGLG